MSVFIGYCFTNKNVGEIRNEIAAVFNLERSGFKDNNAYFKHFCERTKQLLDNRFEKTYGTEKCKKQLNKYIDSKSDKLLSDGVTYSIGLLGELGRMLNSMIPLKNLPSCKSLLDVSDDIARECVKDMANSKYARIGLGLVSILSKVNDNVTIWNVWQYYNDIVNELEREVYIDMWTLTPIELKLYAKAKVERAYCYKAMLKTNVSFVHELKGIIDEATADNDIRNYENENPNNAGFVMSK